MFATCFYVVADVERAQLRFANAGIRPALHLQHGNGGRIQTLGQGTPRPGPVIGIFATPNYVTSSNPMKKGDRVMLFTDGLFEVEAASGPGILRRRHQRRPPIFRTQMVGRRCLRCGNGSAAHRLEFLAAGRQWRQNG